MESRPASRSIIADALVMGLTLAVLIISMLVLVQSADRGNKFWLSLIAAGWTAIVASATSILATRRSRRSNAASLPYNIGIHLLISFYVVGVGTLLLVGATAIPFSYLLVLHLAWSLLYVLAASAMLMGASFVEDLDNDHRHQRSQHILFREQVAELVDRISLTKTSAVNPLRISLETLREATTFATTESLPGSADIDAEMSQQLQLVDVKLQVICQRLNSGTDIEPNQPLIEAEVAVVISAIELVATTLKRRQRLIKQLRT